MRLMPWLMLSSLCLSLQAFSSSQIIFPLHSFKSVIDVCMRAYTDALVLHEKIALQEKYEEILDVLVGRLVRIESYVAQLIYSYKYEATVSFDELEYLSHILEYLEITCTENGNSDLAQALNSLIIPSQQALKQALVTAPVSSFIVSLLCPVAYPLIKVPSHQFV